LIGILGNWGDQLGGHECLGGNLSFWVHVLGSSSKSDKWGNKSELHLFNFD